MFQIKEMIEDNKISELYNSMNGRKKDDLNKSLKIAVENSKLVTIKFLERLGADLNSLKSSISVLKKFDISTNVKIYLFDNGIDLFE